MPVIESIPTAAIETPYIPETSIPSATKKETIIAAQMPMIGGTMLSRP